MSAHALRAANRSHGLNCSFRKSARELGSHPRERGAFSAAADKHRTREPATASTREPAKEANLCSSTLIAG